MRTDFAMILQFLAPSLKKLFSALPPEFLLSLEEIRLRTNQPICLRTAQKDYWLNAQGKIENSYNHAYCLTREEMNKTVLLLADSSLYALEEELRWGYLTLPGGHRVGLSGQGVVSHGELKTLKNINCLNIRIAKEVPGAVQEILPYLWQDNSVLDTLIISPPRGGKTTILRDISRTLADGSGGKIPKQVGIVDERSEIAGSRDGLAQMDIGCHCDILSGCPKEQGLPLMVRAFAPDILITDELGNPADIGAVWNASLCGVTIIASAHGSGIADMQNRPVLKELAAAGIFHRYIVLSRRKGPGTIEGIYDNQFRQLWEAIG